MQQYGVLDDDGVYNVQLKHELERRLLELRQPRECATPAQRESLHRQFTLLTNAVAVLNFIVRNNNIRKTLITDRLYPLECAASVTHPHIRRPIVARRRRRKPLRARQHSAKHADEQSADNKRSGVAGNYGYKLHRFLHQK